MGQSELRKWLGAGLLLATALLTTAAAPYKAPRDLYGRPDFEGQWTNETLTRMRRPPQYGNRLVMTPEEVAALEDPRVWRKVMRVGGQPRTSLLTTPDGLVPPMKPGVTADPWPWPLPPGGRAEDNPETQLIDDQCIIANGYHPGPVLHPYVNNANYIFVQTKDVIVIEAEMIHDARFVRLGGAHRTDGIRPYFGDSIGHFEGETLVVETTNFPAAEPLYGSSKNLKVTERFTRTAAGRMHYGFVVEDPTKWDKPWGGEYEFAQSTQPFDEFSCHENEKSVEHMMDFGRFQERSK